jgi:hypothetical protein
MQASTKRNIKPGYEYDHLFPASENDNETIRRHANLDDTVAFIPKVVQQTLFQTKGIAKKLKAANTYETCKNIWQFVYGHINYKKDEEGFEQVRSPARTWHDRTVGVDCDCYSVFISSILTNLGIPHTLRITKYQRNYFQHIYPIVPNGSRHITIDCVTDQFDYEVPYSEKKDYPMDLQYLSGFDDDGMEELGKIIKRNAIKKNPPISKAAPGFLKKVKKKSAAPLPPRRAGAPATPALPGSSIFPKKKKGFLKKALNVVNKVNPATVMLRNGILAAMKLNIKNVAGRLRWSYLSPNRITEKGIDPVKFGKLVATRQKLENIFYGAGGNPKNLRKAILGGKGNKDKAVSGLGMLPMEEWTGYLNETTPLQELLGDDIFYSENVEGMNGHRGLGALGEPVTLATVGAAMGVIAGIVAALKQIGDIFKKKGQGSKDFDEAKTDAPENNVSIPAGNSSNLPIPKAEKVNSNTSAPDNIRVSTNEASDNFSVTTSERSVTNTANNSSTITEDDGTPGDPSPTSKTDNGATNKTSSTSDNDKPGFWEQNKKWLKPVAIGVGGLTVIAIGYKLMKTGHAHAKSSTKEQGLSGPPHKRKKKKNHHRIHKHHQHKKAVALL